MAKPWRQVVQDPRYQGLSPEEQAAAKRQYFDDFVAPRVSQDERDAALQQFNDFQPEAQLPQRSATNRQPGQITGRGLSDAIVETAMATPEVEEAPAPRMGQPIAFDPGAVERGELPRTRMRFSTAPVDFSQSPLAQAARRAEEEAAAADAAPVVTGIGDAAMQTIRAYPEAAKVRAEKLRLAMEEQVVQRAMREGLNNRLGGKPLTGPMATESIIQRARGAETDQRKAAVLDAVEAYQKALPNTDQWSGAGITSAVLQSAPDTVAALLAGTVGGAGLASAMMFGAAGTEEYGRRRLENMSPDDAGQAALVAGGAEVVGEYVPLVYFLRQIKGLGKKEAGNVLTRMSKGMLTEGAAEMLTEALNIGYQTGVLKEDMTMAEAVDRVLYSGTVGAVMGGGIQGGIETARGIDSGARKAARAWTDAGVGGRITDLLMRGAKTPDAQGMLDAINVTSDAELQENSPRYQQLRTEAGLSEDQARSVMREDLSAMLPADLIADSFTEEGADDAATTTLAAGADGSTGAEPAGSGGDLSAQPLADSIAASDDSRAGSGDAAAVPVGYGSDASSGQQRDAAVGRRTGQDVLREIAEVSDATIPNHPSAMGALDGTFAGQGSLETDADGNIILRRVASGEQHLSKGWEQVDPQEMIDTSLYHGGGRGLPTSGLSRFTEGFSNEATDRTVGTFTIPPAALVQAIRDGNAVLGNLGEGEIVLNPAWAKQFLTDVNGKGKPAPAHAEVRDQQRQAIDQAAHEAATSEMNDLPEPTPAQIEAGNYRKGHVRVQGMDISVETPRGSRRRPEWEPLQDHYGYIRGSKGADKEHVDAFVGPNPEAQTAYVVDQIDPETGKFDEHKVLLGFNSEEEARQGYARNYQADWQGMGAITAIPVSDLKQWLAKPQTRPYAKLQPRSEAKPAGAETPVAVSDARDIGAAFAREYKAEYDRDLPANSEIAKGLARAIAGKNADALRSMNIGDARANPVLRRVFEQISGIKLPKGKAASLAAIDQWAGVSVEQRAAKTEQRKQSIATTSAKRELEALRAKAAGVQVNFQDGTPTTDGAAWIDDMLARGYTRVVQRGPVTYLSNKNGEGFKIPKAELAQYARKAAGEESAKTTPDSSPDQAKDKQQVAAPVDSAAASPAEQGQADLSGEWRHQTGATASVRKTLKGYRVEFAPDDVQVLNGPTAPAKLQKLMEKEGFSRDTPAAKVRAKPTFAPRSIPDPDVRLDIPDPGTGLKKNDIARAMRQTFGLSAQGLINKNIVVPVDDISELPGRLQKWAKGFNADTGKHSIALYDPRLDRVFLIANRIREEEIPSLILHEVGEHYGLPRMIGAENYKALLQRVRDMRRDGSEIVADAWNQVMEGYDGSEDFREGGDAFMREVLAHIAEDPRSLDAPWWQRVLAQIRQWLFELGLRKAITDKDLNLLVLAALRKTMDPNTPVAYYGDPEGAPNASARADRSAQTETPAFKQWFGESKVVDAQGMPLVVYHGTEGEFDTFDMKKRRDGRYGKGFYFTDSPERAASYGKTVVPAYLRIENPGDRGDSDGLIVGADVGNRVFVVRDPKQIKSAVGNSGAFDPSKPGILAAVARPGRGRKEAPPPDGGSAAAGPARGAPEAPPAPEGDKTITGISNARMAEVRKRYGFEEVEQEAVRSFGKVWEEAAPNTVEGWRRAENLLSELRSKMRPITDTEDAMLLHMSIRLQNELDAVDDQMAELNKTGTQADMLPLEVRRRELAEQLDDLGRITKAVGTANARGLNARRMLAARDFSLQRLRARLRSEKKGSPLTEEEVTTLKDMAKRYQDLERQITDVRETRESSEDLERVVQQAEREAAADTTTSPAERRRRSRDLGKRIREAIKDGEKPEDYASLIQRLAKNLVAEGVRDRNALVDGVHKALTDQGSKLTRREVMDAISGYGRFSPLSKDANDVALRQMKGELQLVAKIEDVEAGRPMLRSGVEREARSDEARELDRQLQEAMRRHGVKVTDPASQLKNAMASIKTRLRNQIRDLESAIERGERITRSKGPSPVDAEIEDLRRERDQVQAEYEAMFPVDRSLTEEQRVRMAETGLERTIQRYEARIALGDIYGPEARPGVTSPRLQALRGRRDALKQELETLRDADPGYQERQALRGLQSAIDELERRIRSGELTADQRPRIDTPATQELRRQRDALRQTLDQMRNEAGINEAARLERAMEQTRASITEYTRRIEQGDLSPRQQEEGPTSPELEALRAEREELRKVYAALQRAAKPQKTPEERALQALKTRLATETARLEERIATRDFSEPVKRRVVLDEDALAARAKLEGLKRQFHEMLMQYRIDNLTGGRKLWYNFKEFAGLPRAFQTMLDFSAVLRQGGFIALGHPLRAAKAIRPMLEATFQGEKKQDEIMQRIYERPNARSGLYERSGLYIAGASGKLSNKEEVYMNRWIENFPSVIGGKVLKAFYKGSERAYVTFLNQLRADSFDAMAATLGATKDLTDQEAKGIAYFVNNATGRGSVFGQEGAAELAATIFYSPRYLTSRFAMATMLPVAKAGSIRGARRVALEYGRFLMGLGVVYVLASLAGGEEDKNMNDPRSANFGKIKMGDAWIDPLTGLAQVLVLISRLATGETVAGSGKVREIRGKVRYGTDDAYDVAMRFLRTKLSPAVSIPTDILVGENVIGDEITPEGMLVKSFAPLSGQQIYEVLSAEDVPNKPALMVLGLLGVGVQVRDD